MFLLWKEKHILYAINSKQRRYDPFEMGGVAYNVPVLSKGDLTGKVWEPLGQRMNDGVCVCKTPASLKNMNHIILLFAFSTMQM